MAAFVVLAGGRAYADTAAAEAAFVKAKELSADGKWAEACPLFEASYKADPALGALVNMADCHQHIGKTATAWAEFREALDIAKKRGDQSREEFSQQQIDLLVPRLDKVHLERPPQPTPGLVVKIDDTDVSAFLGMDTPVDPGPHVITATAPDHQPYTQKLAITGEGVAVTVEIPALAVIENPHSGTVTIKTGRADAEILLDGKHIGAREFTGPILRGPHTLRVTAAGARTYQSEIYVDEGATRIIDVPLESTGAVARDLGPRFAAGVSLASGVKLRADDPAIVAVRGELGVRLGARTELGSFVELGRLSTGGSCGYDLAGPMPASPFDIGPRNQIASCGYVMPGIQLRVRLTDGAYAPYLGFQPGFRFGSAHYTPFLGGTQGAPQDSSFLAIVMAVRVGIEHKPPHGAWRVGAFAEVAIAALGDEAPESTPGRDATTFADAYVLLGARGSWGF